MQEIEKITVNISPGDAETIAALVERGDPRTLGLERTKMVTDETVTARWMFDQNQLR